MTTTLSSASSPGTEDSRSKPEQLSVETIFPFNIMQALLDGFFVYLYPLCPFPHEPNFRKSWEMREDRTSNSFLALLCSMVGAFISTFPREAGTIIDLSSAGTGVRELHSHIKNCRYVCNAARALDVLLSDRLGTQEAATSVYLALIQMNDHKWQQCQLYLSQCFSILSSMDANGCFGDPQSEACQYRSSDASRRKHRISGCTINHKPYRNHVEAQIGRRIFWRAFAYTTALDQLGVAAATYVIPLPHPPLPDSVDDIHIHSSHIDNQPADTLSLIVGFNTIAETYKVYSTATKRLTSWYERHEPWHKEGEECIWREALDQSKFAYGNLPPQLRLINDTASAFKSGHHRSSTPLREQRLLQYRLQGSIILASSLSVRSSIVEKLLLSTDNPENKLTRNGCGILTALIAEKQALIQGLLHGIRHVTKDVVEAAADLFVSCRVIHQAFDVQLTMIPQSIKIRYVASTLVGVKNEHVQSFQSEGAYTETIWNFLNALVDLDRTRRLALGSPQAWSQK
jgi:hypothetical protein